MKILYHHRTASKDGQEVHITELVGALRGLGHQVDVVSPAGSDSDAPDDADMGGHRGGAARLRALIPDALMPLAARAYEEVTVRRLVAAGRDQGADFLYERHALDNRVGVRTARKLDVPLLLEVNSPLAREEAAVGRLRELDRALAREMETLRAADAVLVVTEVLKGILVDDGLPAERIHVIPNGVAQERFSSPRAGLDRRELGIPDGAVVLGFIGFPRPWHGLDRVVRAMADAGSGPLAEAVLLIGGEGPALPELFRMAEERGMRDRVIGHGVLRRDQVMPFIDTFDVALQPAAVEYASPLKLFEYLARGVAVIAPDQPNIREVVEDGRSALLFREDDDASFAAQLDRLAGDAELRARLGDGARARIDEAGFTWSRNAERVVDIASELLGARTA